MNNNLKEKEMNCKQIYFISTCRGGGLEFTGMYLL
jgi:hypothetical protein